MKRGRPRNVVWLAIAIPVACANPAVEVFDGPRSDDGNDAASAGSVGGVGAAASVDASALGGSGPVGVLDAAVAQTDALSPTGGSAGSGAACATGMKLCPDGYCWKEIAAVGCGRPGCDPCPDHGLGSYSVCVAGSCDFECIPGWEKAMDGCASMGAGGVSGAGGSAQAGSGGSIFYPPPTCSDGILNGRETSVDCGDNLGTYCRTNEPCSTQEDCPTSTGFGSVCTGMVCSYTEDGDHWNGTCPVCAPCP